jgi:hypothetical protein
MATKKQKRRREKERRHEYEYVYVDSEGREVEVDEPEADAKKNGRAAATARPLKTQGGRTIDPPSWRRVIRRGAIFAPVMMVVVYFLQKDKSLPAAAVQTGFLLALFIPFSYVMDSLMYRSFRKRIARAKDGGTAARR